VAKHKINPGKGEMNWSSNLYFNFLAGFCLVVLPLIYSKATLDNIMMPRLLALNIFLFFITILMPLQEKSGIPKQMVITNTIFKILAAYFMITLISLLFGINFREGIYDTIKVFDFTILVTICSMILSNTKSWPEKLTKFAVVAVFISLAIGYSQYFRYVAGHEGEVLADGRQIIYSVNGLIGHKNHYASFLMLMMPFLGFGILKLKKSWKLLSVIGLIFVIIMIVLLQTRAVWLGILFQLITLAIVITIFYQELNISKKLINLGLALGFVLLAAGLYKVITSAKQADTPLFNQAKSIFQPNDGYNKFRLKIWEITSVMISEKPFSGVGSGNWKLKASEKFGESGFDKNRITWLSPHNDFLWIFAEKGIFGILLFLGMFAFIFFFAIKLIRGKSNKEDKLMTLSFGIGLVGYLVVSFFDFPYEEITHQVLLAIFIAAIISIYERSKRLPESSKVNLKIAKVPVLLFLIFGIGYGFAANLQEMHMRKARVAMQRSDWKELLKESLQAESFCRNLDSEANPIKWYTGMAYYYLSYLDKSCVAFEEALVAAPNNIFVLNSLGKNYIDLKKYKRAEDCFAKALKILPTFEESIINLSTTWYLQGNYVKTLETLELIPPKKRNEVIKNNIKAMQAKISNAGI